MDNNQGFSKTLDILIANTSIIEIVTIIIVVSCIIGIMIYVAIKQTDQDRKCNNLKNLYSQFLRIVLEFFDQISFLFHQLELQVHFSSF